MQPPVVQRVPLFRLRQDPAFRESVAAAHEHHLPHSEFLSWDPDDRDAERELKTYHGETCASCGIHPSLWDQKLGGHRNAVVPEWKFCRVCELVAQAEKAGPPSGADGWHLTLRFNPSK